MTNPAYEATNSDVEKLIRVIQLKHDAGDVYAPFLRWDELEMLIAALERTQTEREEFRRRLKLERSILADADKRIAELESAPNGMMQLSNELAEMKRKCAGLEVACDRNYIDGMKTGWNYCDAGNGEGFNKCIEHRRALISAGGIVEGGE